MKASGLNTEEQLGPGSWVLGPVVAQGGVLCAVSFEQHSGIFLSNLSNVHLSADVKLFWSACCCFLSDFHLLLICVANVMG